MCMKAEDYVFIDYRQETVQCLLEFMQTVLPVIASRGNSRLSNIAWQIRSFFLPCGKEEKIFEQL